MISVDQLHFGILQERRGGRLKDKSDARRGGREPALAGFRWREPGSRSMTLE